MTVDGRGVRGGGVSAAWRAAGWVALIAALAAAGLFVLRRWHDRAAHQTAALAVAERGQWLAMNLALRAAEAAGGEDETPSGNWKEFSALVDSLREVEEELEFVSVRKGGVTLFQEHAGDGRGPAEEAWRFTGPVRMGRQLLSAVNGEAAVPVVTFSAGVTNRAGETVELEAGLRRRAVEREEWPAARAIESMYHLSLVTLGGSFAVCLALVAGTARREERRERERRRQEHLAFSGMMANGIVHDFRNPMSSLRLDAQLLEKETAKGAAARGERMAELAGRMRHTLDRMEKVFQEFLTLARPGEGEASALDLVACARECAEMLAPRFEAAGVTVDWAPIPAEGTAIRAAAAGVKRALMNVMVNAAQHAGNGGRVRISVSRTPEERVRLEVCDSGKGIPRAARHDVFEMFYTTRPQGTGLGLFLARTAVEKYGGRLTAEEPAADGLSGACLRMEFPATTATKENV